MTLPDGGVQEGEYSVGKMHGWIYFIVVLHMYAGHWKLTFADGGVQEGEYSDGMKNGWIYFLVVAYVCRALENNSCRRWSGGRRMQR